jgi:hypothetical protein
MRYGMLTFLTALLLSIVSLKDAGAQTDNKYFLLKYREAMEKYDAFRSIEKSFEKGQSELNMLEDVYESMGYDPEDTTGIWDYQRSELDSMRSSLRDLYESFVDKLYLSLDSRGKRMLERMKTIEEADLMSGGRLSNAIDSCKVSELDDMNVIKDDIRNAFDEFEKIYGMRPERFVFEGYSEGSVLFYRPEFVIKNDPFEGMYYCPKSLAACDKSGKFMGSFSKSKNFIYEDGTLFLSKEEFMLLPRSIQDKYVPDAEAWRRILGSGNHCKTGQRDREHPNGK